MKIYIAASFLRINEARRLRERLIAAGHIVTSRWIDAEGATTEYVHSDPAMAQYALKDCEDVYEGEALVCITGDAPEQRTRGGKHSEFGGALFIGKRIFLLGPREQIFHWHPAVRVAATEKELIALLAA